MVERATFAAGCFWHIQEEFDKLKGITKTTVGYTGGKTKNPTYKEVCTDKTGHAEAIQIEYDPKIITYEKLLNKFWTIHNPTQFNRQGPDVGIQYRSAIFYHDEKQKKLAEKTLKEQQPKYEEEIKTQIVKAEKFYPAEDYHQKYYKKHKVQACLANILTK